MHVRPRAAIPFLILGLVLGAAAASAEDLDAATHVDAAPLDSLETNSDGTPLDSADSGDDGTPLADAPDVGPAPPDLGGSLPLDTAPDETSLPLDRVEGDPAWRPTPCNELAIELPPAPSPSDARGWQTALRAAEESMRRSRQALQRADAAYSRSLTSHEPLGEERAEIIEARDRARSEYSRARCAVPAWLERARRAGVEPGVLRPFVGS